MSGDAIKRERNRQMRDQILILLKQLGPCTSHTLAVHLGEPVGVVTQNVIVLRNQNHIAVRLERVRAGGEVTVAQCPGETRRMAQEPPRPQQQRTMKEAESAGCDSEDEAWLAYWRRPRAERRALPPPESGRCIAGWDVGLSLDQGRPWSSCLYL